jgi:hypothetical protein
MGIISAIIGWLQHHLGLRTDTASATGSLHAKVKEARDTILGKDIVNYGTAIKSIQRGTIAIGTPLVSNTATISAVNTAKSVTNWLGYTVSDTTYSARGHYRLCLTDSTTVTATRSVAGAETVTINFEVIEYY